MTTRRRFLQTSSFMALEVVMGQNAEARRTRGVNPGAPLKGITNIVSDDQPAEIIGGNLTRSIIRSFPLTLGQVNGVTTNTKPGVPTPPTTFGTYNGFTLYPNAYCDGPVCEPARAGIMTGSLDFHHTIHTNQDDEFFDEPSDVANSFYGAGWLTALFGKRFVNFPLNVGLNGTGPGRDGSGNAVVHIPYGYGYGFINIGEPVNPYQYPMITGPAPGFTPPSGLTAAQCAWAGNVAYPGSCYTQAFDFNNTAGFLVSQTGTTLTVTGATGPVIAANLTTTFQDGSGSLSAGMTLVIPGFTNETIVSQLTSTDPNGTLCGNGTYQVSVSQPITLSVTGTHGSGTKAAVTFTDTTANSFTSNMVGGALYISGGTNVTAGWYPVVGFTSSSVVTLASSPGTSTGAFSGASWTLGGLGTQTNATQNAGHNSVATFNAYLAWLNANKTAILADKRFYAYVAPFSPHDPPIAPPQDGNSGGGGVPPGSVIALTNLDLLPSYNSTGTNGPSFYAAQPVFDTTTNPTNVQMLNKVNAAEQAVLCIDRAISGTVANSGFDGILQTFNGWGILQQTVLTYTTDQGINYGQWKFESKRTQHDSTMRVPMFAFWGQFGPGTGFNATPVSQTDLAPTFAKLGGVVPAAAQVDGVDIIAGTRTAVAGRWVGGDAGGVYNSPPTGGGGSTPAFDLVYNSSGTYFRTEPYAPTSGPCTISIANPAVITYANNFGVGQVVNFTTTGALPTGLSVGVNYYVIAAGLSTSAFRVSLNPGGTVVATSGSQSGVQTLTATGTIQAPVALTEEGLYNYGTTSTFTGSISSGTLTSGAVTGDPLVVGHVIKGAGITPGNYITVVNGGGSFTLFYPDTVGSEAMTATDCYQMNNVQGVGGYASTKTTAISNLNSLFPNGYCVNDPSYVPASVNSGNITLTEPARVRDGMVLWAVVAWRGSAPMTAPPGWTVAATTITNANALNTSAAACGSMLLVQQRSGAPNLTFTRTGGNTAIGWIYAYDIGGRTFSLIGGQSAQASVNNSVTVSVPGFTATVANQGVVVFGAHGRNTSIFNVNSALNGFSNPTLTSSGPSNNLSRNDPFSAPQVGHWTQKDNEIASDGTLRVRGIFADGLLSGVGKTTGTISYICAIGALPGIMAATFSVV